MQMHDIQASKKMASDKEEFLRFLKGTTAVTTEISLGDVEEEPNAEVYVALVHDGSMAHPPSAVFIDWTGSKDESLQEAFEMMEEHTLEYHRKHDDGYLEELQEEWGDEWNEILTETFDGGAWVMTAKEAQEALDEAGIEYDKD